MRGVIGTIALVLVACGGGRSDRTGVARDGGGASPDSGIVISPDGGIDAYAWNVCSIRSACCFDSIPCAGCDPALVCRSRFDQLRTHAEERGLSYDAACATRQQEILAARGCVDTFPDELACQLACPLYHGDVANGGSCDGAGEDPRATVCAAGLVCVIDTCRDPCRGLDTSAVCDRECSDDERCNNRECVPKLANGESCLADGDCASGRCEGACTGLAEGESCAYSIDPSDNPCAAGLTCVPDDPLSPDTARCSAGNGEGESCIGSIVPCRAGFTCEDRTCVPSGAGCGPGGTSTSRCTPDEACVDFDTGACEPIPGEGEPCLVDALGLESCAYGLRCENLTCPADAPAGSYCDRLCPAGCDDRRCVPPQAAICAL